MFLLIRHNLNFSLIKIISFKNYLKGFFFYLLLFNISIIIIYKFIGGLMLYIFLYVNDNKKYILKNNKKTDQDLKIVF